MRNLFIVTSCLFPKTGTPVSSQERFEKTKDSIKSIIKKDPEAFIVLSDVSLNPVPEEFKKSLNELVNVYLDLSEITDLVTLSELGLKSAAETILMMTTIQALKNNGLLDGIGRIFKLSGRIILSDEFDITFYNDKQGKYVFRKRDESWRTDKYTHYLEARLYSFCNSLVDTHLDVLGNCLSIILSEGLDIEHALLLKVPEDKLIEVERVYCQGQPAGLNGQWKYD